MSGTLAHMWHTNFGRCFFVLQNYFAFYCSSLFLDDICGTFLSLTRNWLSVLYYMFCCYFWHEYFLHHQPDLVSNINVHLVVVEIIDLSKYLAVIDFEFWIVSCTYWKRDGLEAHRRCHIESIRHKIILRLWHLYKKIPKTSYQILLLNTTKFP